MNCIWIATVLALQLAAAQACTFPNETETKMHWWDCGDGSFKITDVTSLDPEFSYQYPILLHDKTYVIIQAENNVREITENDKNVKLNIVSWQYSGWSSCSWTTIPTFGLLDNLDACGDGGLMCPVATGQQQMQIMLDFSKYASIIKLLKNDAPYQLKLVITDTLSNKDLCLYIQARAKTS
uniref:ML domain-containing protein n=1 Tax=Syphacia muris TaxID=451379 RepID=A0A0N5AHF3_9BILA